jgi:predicted DNA-binding transcriptional regulator AlpA
MAIASPAELHVPGPAPPPKLISSEDIAAILRVSVRTVFRLRARGDLPPPVEVSRNIVRWRWADVKEYLDNLKARKGRRDR